MLAEVTNLEELACAYGFCRVWRREWASTAIPKVSLLVVCDLVVCK